MKKSKVSNNATYNSRKKAKKSLGKVAKATVKKVNEVLTEKPKLKSKKEIEDQWISPAERSRMLKLKTTADEVIQSKESRSTLTLDHPSASMGLIEAKVEAASASRLWGRTVYIVQAKRDPENFYLVLDKAPTEYHSFYSEGAENGQGVMKVHSKYDTAKKQNKAAAIPDEDGIVKSKPIRTAKVKSPAQLSHVELKLSDLKTLQQSCIATIDKKEWIVQVRGGWCLNRTLMEAADSKNGLIMVIKDQGYYLYPKSMWGDFASIFASRSYTDGGNYSQSILPKKFDKYFKQF